MYLSIAMIIMNYFLWYKEWGYWFRQIYKVIS